MADNKEMMVSVSRNCRTRKAKEVYTPSKHQAEIGKKRTAKFSLNKEKAIKKKIGSTYKDNINAEYKRGTLVIYIYWIPKMHKNPYKHRFIASSSKCSTKPLSILLTKLLTHIKQGLQKYCETAYSRSGINLMWILKNSKELLEHLKSQTFNRVTSIKSFDFSTLYTTIPHQKLKDRLTSIIRNAFIFKNGNRRYKYLVLGHEETYFVKEHSDSKSKYSEDDIIKMLEFLVDNIFVVFAGKVFQQTVGIPMGTNCALFSPTSFCIHTKRISYNLCSLRERNI